MVANKLVGYPNIQIQLKNCWIRIQLYRLVESYYQNQSDIRLISGFGYGCIQIRLVFLVTKLARHITTSLEHQGLNLFIVARLHNMWNI